MKKRGLNIHLSNRLSYTLIAIFILIAVGIGVYAYGTANPSVFGHSYNELQPCSGTQILKMNAGGTAWECSALSITETDPTVMSWAKESSPTLPLGLEMITVDTGSTTNPSGIAYCPSGKKIVSGGCWCGSSSTLGSSRPYSASLTAWYCSCKGSGASTTYAVCAKVT